MRHIHEYIEYREWLKDWFQERKQNDSWFSYRQLGGRIGVDPGYLSHVVHGNAHLADDDVPKLAKEAKLAKEEAEYLAELVRFNKARKPREISERFSRLSQLKAIQATTLDDRRALFFARWHHMAVRLAISLDKFSDDWESLAKRLSFPPGIDEIRQSVALMEELGLLRRGPDGDWEITDRFVSSGDSWSDLAVRAYQLQSLQMAERALVELPKEVRDISTASFTLPASELPLLKDRVKEFRQSLLRWSAGHEDCDTAFQVNIQIFPMTNPPAREGVGGAPETASSRPAGARRKKP